MGLLSNLAYVIKVNRLAAKLGQTERRMSRGRYDLVVDSFWNGRSEEHKEKLFDLLMAAPMIRQVLDRHGANGKTLRDLYNVVRRRTGGWEGRYYMPVHALSFPQPLEFLLASDYQRFSTKKFETILDDVQLKIIEYFRQGAPSTFDFSSA